MQVRCSLHWFGTAISVGMPDNVRSVLALATDLLTIGRLWFLHFVHKISMCSESIGKYIITLHWRHNDHDGVSNHQPHGCLLNRLFRHRSKKTSKLRVTGLCVGNSPGPVNYPHKGPVTQKMFPFHDVIMHAMMLFCSIIEHACFRHKSPILLTITGSAL